uniref:Uncharacterized protein n=1 Tax=Oryza glumipatula TaxID=40148 RepID=A0A0E0A3V6_9ORYZ
MHEIDVLDDIEINPSCGHLLPKVVIHQLFVRRVETKSRRNLRLLLRAAAAHTRSIHFDRSIDRPANILIDNLIYLSIYLRACLCLPEITVMHACQYCYKLRILTVMYVRT